MSERLILEHRPLVTRVAVHLAGQWGHLNARDVEEMIADGNLGLVKAAASFKHDVPFDVHAYGRIRAEIIDGLRARTHVRNVRRIEFVSLDARHDAGVDEPDPNAEERLLAAEDAAMLQAPLETLPARDRTVLAMRYRQDMTLREIGKKLDVTESRACQLHGAALRHLREQLPAAA